MRHAQLNGSILKWIMAAICALGVIGVWLQAAETPDSAMQEANTKPAVNALSAIPQLQAANSLELYRPAFDRPLFHPNRRPFFSKPAPPPTPSSNQIAAQQQRSQPIIIEVPPPQGFVLRGAIISGPFRSAIFERVGQNDYVHLREGEELQGWNLVHVERRNVVLKNGTHELTWPLVKDIR